MPSGLTRRRALAVLAVGGCAPSLLIASRVRAHQPGPAGTDSCYGLAYTHAIDELIGDLLHGERGDPERESDTPHRDWYSQLVRRHLGGWGPKPRAYPPLAGLERRTLTWQRERVIATAARFVGYGYQHHHIPDWNPPADWPWKETCVGHNGKGFDCSNFTSFVYNQGFGIRMNSSVVHQAELHRALEGHEHSLTIRRVELPAGYEQRQKVLRAGDLVYVRGREQGPITHVVIWVGSIGRAKSDAPIVLDSHGSGVVDDFGRAIACGVQLRPFRQKSWYNRCASHAHRIFHDLA